jgi:hypothetical protein
MGTSSAWTPERRARQAEAIRRWRPWDQSTGPKTQAGKARVARNAYKGGHRERLRDHARLYGEVSRAGHEVAAIIGAARRGNLLYRGEPISPNYTASETFLAAQARYDAARAAYWQHVVAHPPDDDAVADAIMARMEARLRELEDRAADTTSP